MKENAEFFHTNLLIGDLFLSSLYQSDILDEENMENVQVSTSW